jgi:hypothetical protein
MSASPARTNIEAPKLSVARLFLVPEGQLEISATVVDSAMLDWWLRGFGGAVGQVGKKSMKNEET